ncbi:hypothetical protein D3C76_1736400 [compost metagenome]
MLHLLTHLIAGMRLMPGLNCQAHLEAGEICLRGSAFSINCVEAVLSTIEVLGAFVLRGRQA